MTLDIRHHESPEPDGPQTLEHLTEFAQNPEPRCPCIILIDQSGSMDDRCINSVNQRLREFRQDELAAARADLAIISFNQQTHLVTDFTTVSQMELPTIQAQGSTNISGAIHWTIDLLEQRKRTYRDNGIESYRPIIMLLTDGEPTSDDPALLARVSSHIARRRRNNTSPSSPSPSRALTYSS